VRLAATIAAGLLGISATSLPVVAGDDSVAAVAPSAGSITSSALTAFSLEFDPVGTIGSLGVEWTYTGDWSDSAFGYDVYMRWDSSGRWFTWETDTSSLDYGRPTGYHSGPLYDPAATIVRIEFYPHDADGCSGDDPEQDCYWEVYDPFDENHGGIAIQIERTADGLPNDLGPVHLATPGDAWGGFPIVGSVVDAGPVTSGRVSIDAFQIPCSWHETCAPVPTNAQGTSFGAFGTLTTTGDTWSTAIGWPGRYTIFLTDNATGRRIQGFDDLAPGSIPDIDLGAPCFGLDRCVVLSGASEVSPPVGTFHPTAPTRVLDTRIGLGIPNGAVRSGDGSASTTNPEIRLDERRNHDLVVTGVGGVPASGVSAVLLNLTAVEPTANGYLTVGPRPAGQGNVFDDQSDYGAWPSASNLNLSRGVTAPNMVLARVGAGGAIRFHLSEGSTHLIADVAGWFGYGPNADGVGFSGVTPTRLLDSRLAGGPFSPGEIRRVAVAGIAGVPADARSVVLNVTAADPVGSGYVTVFPAGSPAPNASNLNLRRGVTRPNLVVVEVGASGAVDLLAAGTSTHLLVDVLGYFGDGGMTTAVDPVRVFDTRTGRGTAAGAMGHGETRTIRIGGVEGVPAGATGVHVNITVVSPTAAGYLSVWPTGAAQPTVSNLNWRAGEVVPNMAIVGLGGDGTLQVFLSTGNDSTGSGHVLVDVLGWIG